MSNRDPQNFWGWVGQKKNGSRNRHKLFGHVFLVQPQCCKLLPPTPRFAGQILHV